VQAPSEPTIDEVVSSPAEALPPPSREELDLLREVGRRWAGSLGHDRSSMWALPVDPTLSRGVATPRPGGIGRVTPVEMFEPQRDGDVVATEEAAVPPSPLGRLVTSLRRAVLGPPLATTALAEERMPRLIALPVLSSDLLSSVAYGPEAMLSVLVLGGSAAIGLSLPIALALAALMIAVGLSYRQTIRAYPSGAGSYIVATDNLGELPGLAAAAGLMTDYVLTVSVSVASGVAAITSAIPALAPQAVPMGVGMIAVLLAGNLRGVRQAGYLFAGPTYAFLLAMFLLVGAGLWQAAGRGFTAVAPPSIPAVEAIGPLLVLRAFASGATSMTGIEAVSNAIPVFRPPQWRNARTTLTWMVGLLVVTFLGLVVLIHLDGVVPRSGETLLSQLGHRVFGGGAVYACIQAATALILLFAANTAFNDCPRLLYYMARNDHAPHAFLRMGDRLAFSNGIIALAATAVVILIAFHGSTEALIPLYAVGVFLAFTLSQTGMVVHWWRHRDDHWLRSMVVNATGALLCALVLLTAAVTKLAEGAWVVVIALPLLIWLALCIRAHYDTVRTAVALRPPGTDEGEAPASAEAAESPEQVRHLMVAPVARLDRASLRALAYAASLRQPVLAVHLSPDEEEGQRFREQWDAWGDHVALEVVISPYRATVPPLVHYIAALHAQRPELTLTVVLPELVVTRRWQRLLHSRVALRLRQALEPQWGTVITTVPFHIPG
jgi:amino acid transporter